MFDAYDYRKGAEMARAEGHSVLADTWDKEADRQEALEAYFAELWHTCTRFSPGVGGGTLYARLLKDGWTPPKGVLTNGRP